MARRPRLDLPGFHHIVNRGVARNNIYNCNEDKDKFLVILCNACSVYRVNIHDYCLMDNHYHLLIETTSENLSLFMRLLKSTTPTKGAGYESDLNLLARRNSR